MHDLSERRYSRHEARRLYTLRRLSTYLAVHATASIWTAFLNAGCAQSVGVDELILAGRVDRTGRAFPQYSRHNMRRAGSQQRRYTFNPLYTTTSVCPSVDVWATHGLLHRQQLQTSVQYHRLDAELMENKCDVSQQVVCGTC